MKVKHAMRTLATALFALALTGAFETSAAANPRYIAITGSAWRLALGDMNGDGKQELIYGAYDGAVRCVNPETGTLLWEAVLGGFPFAVATADVNGDGRSAVFAACADGVLYALGPDGRLRWTVATGLPLYNVAIGRMEKNGQALIASTSSTPAGSTPPTGTSASASSCQESSPCATYWAARPFPWPVVVSRWKSRPALCGFLKL